MSTRSRLKPAWSYGLPRRRFLQLGSGLVGAAALAACGSGAGSSGPSSSGAPVPSSRVGGRVRMAFGGDAGNSNISLDPGSPNRVYEALGALYGYLTQQGMDGQPMPDLAVKWSSNETADQWTFSLRQGVIFHNGQPFTSADVVYTFRRTLDPATGSGALGVLAPYLDPAGITAPDPATVVFTLKRPQADWPTMLYAYQLGIVPQNAGATIGTTGVGTGPFILTSFNRDGGQVSLRFNPNYWRGRPQLDGLDLILIPDASARTNALLAGQVELIYAGLVSVADAMRIKATSGLATWEVPSGYWNSLSMRCDAEPFTDVRVRQAFKAVVDEDQMLAQMVQGHGKPAGNNPVGLIDPYRLTQPTPKPDIAKAKQLLAAAGHPDGLSITLDTSTVAAEFSPLTQTFQQQAAAAGIRVTINQHDPKTYWNQFLTKGLFYTNLWGPRPAAQLLNEAFLSTSKRNESRWASPALDTLIGQAAASTDVTARTQLYHQAQQILVEESGSIIPIQVNVIRAGSAKLRNFPGRADGRPDYVTLATEE